MALLLFFFSLFLFFFSLFPNLPGVHGETQLQIAEGCPGGTDCKRGEQSPSICPAGFFCPGGNSTEGPLPCPPGTFRSAGTALPSRSCLPCPVGFFNPRPGQKSCLPCPVGFFNPRPGQKSCLSCGSQAVQPKEGQQSCVCLGKGQVFQPRDALCTCPPGFRGSGRDGRLCVAQTYPVCRDSASRNQEGQCLTRRGWARYCSKVCAVPRDFQGYDKVLGLCICHTESLESLCNSQCQRQQKTTLQLTCAGKRAQLLIAHSNGSKAAVFLEGLRTVLPRPNFSLEDFCAAGQGQHPAHVVEMSGRGFLGVYNPDPQLLHDLITQNEASAFHKNSPPSAAAPAQPGHEECRDPREQSLGAPNSTSQTPFFGILNPITCIGGNVTLVFIVSREHFPVYDVNNLYNTNGEFDWGDFRILAEEIRESSQKFLLFLSQFQAPGTYVLRLSSNRHRRMYVRVMPPGGSCYEEGPFFPSTPRFAVQAGMAPRAELLLRPDWAAIVALLSGLLLLLAAALALALLCQGLGWAQQGSPRPAFRRQQLQYSLDRYSSKIPTVFSIQKCHPSLQDKAGDGSSAAGTAFVLRRGDAWEPEGQIDLEAFDTQVFFELLLRQSQSVTAALGHCRDEVKILYHRVMSEISSLKNLWIKALSIPGKGEHNESPGGEAKEQVLSSPQSSENSQTARVCGTSGASNPSWESIPHKLIPLLRAMVQLLQGNRGNGSSPESPAAVTAQEGELTAVDPAALSPREFVVFQYGLSILQFLTFHINAPEITLGVASSLAPGKAFRNSFFYQNSKKQLLVPRDSLSSVGGFLLLLVHGLAHVTAGGHSTNRLFLRLFHQALRACLGEMFSLRLQLSAAAPRGDKGDKSPGLQQLLLKEEPFTREEINLISRLLEVRVKSSVDMDAFEKNLLLRVKAEEPLEDKWLGKTKENFLHPLGSSGREARFEEEPGTALSPPELQDRVDALTEELLRITEDEEQFLSSEGNEDLLSYYLEITSVEKQSLLKQINALEEQIAQGRKF